MDIPTPPITSPAATGEPRQRPPSRVFVLEEPHSSPFATPAKRTNHRPRNSPLETPKRPYSSSSDDGQDILDRPPGKRCKHTTYRTRNQASLERLPSSVLVMHIVIKYLPRKSTCLALARTCKSMYAAIVPYLWEDPFDIKHSPVPRVGMRDDPVLDTLTQTLRLASISTGIQSLSLTRALTVTVPYQYIKYVPSACIAHGWCSSVSEATVQIDLQKCVRHTANVRVPNVTGWIADFSCVKYRRVFSSMLWSSYLVNPLCAHRLTTVHIDAAHAITDTWVAAVAQGPTWPCLTDLTLALSVTKPLDPLVACIRAHCKTLVNLSVTLMNAGSKAHVLPLVELGPSLVHCRKFHFVPADDSVSPGPWMATWLEVVFTGFPASTYKHLELYPVTEYSRTHYFGTSLYPLGSSCMGSDLPISPPTPCPSPPLPSVQRNRRTIRIDRLTLWTPLVLNAWEMHVFPIVQHWGFYTRVLDVAPWPQHPRAGYKGYSPQVAFGTDGGDLASRLSRTVTGLEVPEDWGPRLYAGMPNLHTLHSYCLSISPSLEYLVGLSSHESLQYIHLGLAPPYIPTQCPQVLGCLQAHIRANSAYDVMLMRALALVMTPRAVSMKRVSWMCMPRMPGETMADQALDLYANGAPNRMSRLVECEEGCERAWALCSIGVFGIQFLAKYNA